MGDRRLVRVILTWTLPLLLVASAVTAARESIRLAQGMHNEHGKVYSTPSLDLLMFGLVLAGCVVCFRLPSSALLTAAGCVGVLWYYSDLIMQADRGNPLQGMVYFVTFPCAVVCVSCGVLGFVQGWRKRRRADPAT